MSSTEDIIHDLDIHGLTGISRANSKAEKCMWLLLIATAFGVSVAYTASAVLEYLKNPVITTYNVEVNRKSLAMPVILLCPLNGLNQTYINENPLAAMRIREYQEVNRGRNVTVVEHADTEESLNGEYEEHEGLSAANATDILFFADAAPLPANSSVDIDFGWGSTTTVGSDGSSDSSETTAITENLPDATVVSNQSAPDFLTGGDVLEYISVTVDENGEVVDETPKKRVGLLEQRKSTWSKAQAGAWAGSGEGQATAVVVDGADGPPQNKISDEELMAKELQIYGDESIAGTYLRAGFSADMFLRECEFGGVSVSCKSRAFYDQKYGKCFAITSEYGQRNVDHGFSFVLDLHSQDSVTQNIQDGVFMRISNHLDPWQTDGYYLKPGEYTKVALRLQENRRITNCRYAKQLRLFNSSYSAHACRAECIQAELFNACGCIHPIDPQFLGSDVSSCSVNATRDCLIPRIQEAQNMSRDILTSEEPHAPTCSDTCLPDCDAPSYSVSLSYGRLPAIGMLKSPTGSEDYTNPQYWPDNIALVDVAFSAKDVVIVEQMYSMSFTTCVSNIGGQLGLWIGASIFTLIELLIAITRRCRCVCCVGSKDGSQRRTREQKTW